MTSWDGRPNAVRAFPEPCVAPNLEKRHLPLLGQKNRHLPPHFELPMDRVVTEAASGPLRNSRSTWRKCRDSVPIRIPEGPRGDGICLSACICITVNSHVVTCARAMKLAGPCVLPHSHPPSFEAPSCWIGTLTCSGSLAMFPKQLKLFLQSGLMSAPKRWLAFGTSLLGIPFCLFFPGSM